MATSRKKYCAPIEPRAFFVLFLSAAVLVHRPREEIDHSFPAGIFKYDDANDPVTMCIDLSRHPEYFQPCYEAKMKSFWLQFIARLPLAETTVLLQDGRAHAIRGTVQARLLHELAELARTHGIATACIHARKTNFGYALALHGIPASLQQRFRNVWGVNCK